MKYSDSIDLINSNIYNIVVSVPQYFVRDSFTPKKTVGLLRESLDPGHNLAMRDSNIICNLISNDYPATACVAIQGHGLALQRSRVKHLTAKEMRHHIFFTVVTE